MKWRNSRACKKALMTSATLVDASLIIHLLRPRPGLLEKQDERLEKGEWLFHSPVRDQEREKCVRRESTFLVRFTP